MRFSRRWAAFVLCAALPLGGMAQAQALQLAAASAAKRAPGQPAALSDSYADRPDAIALAERLAERLDLPATRVRAVLAQARRQPAAIRLMTPAPGPVSQKNWAAYRARFVEPVRIAAGLRFWDEHVATLARAEQTYGVPAAVVVGLIGVETLYGEHMGTYRVLDALTTLALDFPPEHPKAALRQAFFQDELQAFLALTLARGEDPLLPLGSYAGASGLPQFMPSSITRYAVDFDGDGRIALERSAADAIGSVAAYLAAFGWKPGQPTHHALTLQANAEAMQTLLAPDILPTFSATEMQALGVQLSPAGQAHGGPMALVELLNGDPAQGGQPPSYVAGTENFYVITRYNWSSYYAMAVIELAQAIAQARQSTLD